MKVLRPLALLQFQDCIILCIKLLCRLAVLGVRQQFRRERQIRVGGWEGGGRGRFAIV